MFKLPLLMSAKRDAQEQKEWNELLVSAAAFSLLGTINSLIIVMLFVFPYI